MSAGFLHPPTMFSLTVAVSLSLAALLAWIGAGRHRELMLWAAALALNSITFLLYALRGQVSDLLSVVLANALLMLASVLLCEGLHHFRGTRPPRLLLWSPVGLTVLLFPMLLDTFVPRLLLGTLMGLFMGACALLALRPVPPAILRHSRGRRVFALGILLTMLGYLLFGGYALLRPEDVQSITAPGPIQGLSFATALLSCLLQTLGALVMLAERSEATLRDTQRIRRFRNRILEMVSRGRSLDETLRTLVRGAEALRPGVQCDVQLASPGGPPIDDIEGHPAWQPLRARAKAAGHAHLIIQPIRGSDHRLLGALALFHGGARAVSDDELDSIEQMTRLAGLAIERDAWSEQLRAQALYDGLTGLPNRRLLQDHLGLALAGNARSGRHAALLFLDLDGFKPLNDRHGHQAGDQLLTQAGARLRACIREGDTVARFGGDEFVVLLTDLDSDRDIARQTAAQLARRISAVMAEPYRLDPPSAPPVLDHRCTVSLGVHMLFEPDDHAVDILIDHADNAMYVAKKLGGGSVRFSDEDERAPPLQTAAAGLL